MLFVISQTCKNCFLGNPTRFGGGGGNANLFHRWGPHVFKLGCGITYVVFICLQFCYGFQARNIRKRLDVIMSECEALGPLSPSVTTWLELLQAKVSWAKGFHIGYTMVGIATVVTVATAAHGRHRHRPPPPPTLPPPGLQNSYFQGDF